MSGWIQPPDRRVLGMVGRVVLTGLVVWGVLVCLGIFLNSPYFADRAAPDQGLASEVQPAAPRGSSKMLTTLWPHFPASSPVQSHDLEVNGITYLSERWETCAAPAAVLGYYKSQMAARGWRDVTEESYNLNPEAHREKSGDAGIQDQKFLDTYRKIIESCLVLRRAGWTMQVATEPSKNKANWFTVTINAAAAPSLKEFANPWTASQETGGRESPKVMDFVEQGGDQRYHTRITQLDQAPIKAFEDTLADLQKAGWQPSYTSPLKGDSYTAVLTKGENYGALAVTQDAKGQGTSVTWTEVSQ